MEQPACGGLDLGAFLLTPVQRVPRYILLLKQLLKYTDPTHPDYRHINACLDRLRDFLARLNDSMEHSFQLVHATLSPSAPAPKSGLGSSVSSGHRYVLYEKYNCGLSVVTMTQIHFQTHMTSQSVS